MCYDGPMKGFLKYLYTIVLKMFINDTTALQSVPVVLMNIL